MASIKLTKVFLLLLLAWCLDGSPGEPNAKNEQGLVSFGLIEPAETTKLEMKPLYQGLKDKSMVNRLVKRNRKKAESRRDSHRLVKTESNGDGSDETNGADGLSGIQGLIKIDKGLLESHKQRELDHVDQDAKLDEDKFVKIVWDKGDGFVKKWHWDRGEKVKEDHTVAAKKHLGHHEKAKGDELIKQQHGAVVQAVNNQEQSKQDRVESLLKDERQSGSSANNDDFAQELRLSRTKPGKGSSSQEAIFIPIRPGDDDESEDDNDGKVFRSKKFRKIELVRSEGNDDEDATRARSRRYPSKKGRYLKQRRTFRGKSDDGEDDKTADDGDDDKDDDDDGKGKKTKIKKHRDYHRRVTVREEKSQLNSQERFNGKPNAGGKAYETGSKGSGYIKRFTVSSDGQNNSIDPFDFTSLVGDQSKKVETQASEVDDDNSKDEQRQRPQQRLQEQFDNQLTINRIRNQLQPRQAKQNHGPNTLHIIDPR